MRLVLVPIAWLVANGFCQHGNPLKGGPLNGYCKRCGA